VRFCKSSSSASELRALPPLIGWLAGGRAATSQTMTSAERAAVDRRSAPESVRCGALARHCWMDLAAATGDPCRLLLKRQPLEAGQGYDLVAGPQCPDIRRSP
jgi:hypothetical protein